MTTGIAARATAGLAIWRAAPDGAGSLLLAATSRLLCDDACRAPVVVSTTRAGKAASK